MEFDSHQQSKYYLAMAHNREIAENIADIKKLELNVIADQRRILCQFLFINSMMYFDYDIRNKMLCNSNVFL